MSKDKLSKIESKLLDYIGSHEIVSSLDISKEFDASSVGEMKPFLEALCELADKELILIREPYIPKNVSPEKENGYATHYKIIK